ncbi:translational GTPase TypA [Bradyrhizobium sp. U87765 SZCCT0131]|uniref:translational GTPase TypA n=1 Tax=unclassified Bradyrhizobium TaxID=2631580 RepID=UPI001BA687B8|nr:MULTISPECIES: translational GTPase TypA [unclassified Bradyrhizobium]MBR1216931.1 translational GTPase TypA [Bradyrhizobium sp. U87765 SZCCT0131]MBR1259313.1 translational GTPase TypA [Bradyrhizobium sp. U87765 SZCCT0134]MBR1305454.1 translational GTPase TypA [Bradyrhizobium sp. U87765 SZCCT0110]MBR1321821.1 translational GTPase TypA [Bradyrhizobium sp. U87765 SZCCT0109]MBR1350901.1 translational GTPase TypA [Bradyrhizobium sp. U87765 SZCCT0048]
MNMRNVAIIAHVDHGKTTLVDKLLQQSGTFRDNQKVTERAMDSNDIERERGITILAKAASVQWKDTRINIVDTPGHADFGGEVERILNMVDGALVLVDAAEGPLPQTKFVVSKALKVGLKPIVVINKVDRPDARPTEVINEVFDLFAALDATEEQLDFPILYGSAKQGWMAESYEGPQDQGMQPLFDLVLRHVPPPTVEEGPFRMIGTILEANPYLGRIITGRISSGTIKPNQAIKVLAGDGKLIEQGRISKILAFRGLERVPLDEAEAGDIVAIAGLSKGTVADTFCDPLVDTPLVTQPIDPPTVSMSFIVNNSPLAGTEGDKVTSRMIRDRLMREAEGNVALRVVEASDKDSMEVSGRGELQLAILIENMRREGFELSVSRPRVVLQKDDAGQWLEPIEEVVIDVDEEHSGVVVQKMSERKAEMIEMRPSGGNRLRLVFYAPTRGLIGYQGELLTDTRGTAIMNRLFHGYGPYKGEIAGRRNGVLISNDQGEAVAYAMFKLEDRGPMMIEPGWKVYRGMIVGEHTRDNDLEINVLKGKQLTNIRTTSKDEAVRLTPPIRMTLEKALSYIEDDELVEVTPKSIRLRKKHLDPNERKRAEKSKEALAG